MKMVFSIILLCLTLLSLLQNQCLAQEGKACRMRNLETKLTMLVGQFGMKAHTWPETEQQMKEWCRSIPGESNAAKAHIRKCISSISATIMSVSVFAAEKVDKTYCNKKTERTAYIARGKCGNAGKTGTTECWTNLINVVSNVKHMNSSAEKIPAFCCSFFEWKECTLQTYQRIGSPVCTPKHIEDFDSQISRGSLDPLNIFCSDYDESDRCGPIQKKFIRTAPAKQYRTPFPAIIEVFDSL